MRGAMATALSGHAGELSTCPRKAEGMPPDEAWAEMEQYSWNSDIPILPDYLNSHMAQLTEKLVQLGVIERVPEPLPVLASD